ncbi:MAG: hypothetical protein ACKO37_03835 [Vampirovibrionales bacterium]
MPPTRLREQWAYVRDLQSSTISESQSEINYFKIVLLRYFNLFLNRELLALVSNIKKFNQKEREASDATKLKDLDKIVCELETLHKEIASIAVILPSIRNFNEATTFQEIGNMLKLQTQSFRERVYKIRDTKENFSDPNCQLLDNYCLFLEEYIRTGEFEHTAWFENFLDIY